jgi:alcohol dehydrogenase
MYTKGITFVTGRANVRHAMPQVLALARSGAFHPEHVTTSTVDWTDAADALTAGHWTKLVFRRD